MNERVGDMERPSGGCDDSSARIDQRNGEGGVTIASGCVPISDDCHRRVAVMGVTKVPSKAFSKSIFC